MNKFDCFAPQSWNETEKNGPTIAPVPVTSSAARWEFSREKMRLQTLLGQGNFGQVRLEVYGVADWPWPLRGISIPSGSTRQAC